MLGIPATVCVCVCVRTSSMIRIYSMEGHLGNTLVCEDVGVPHDPITASSHVSIFLCRILPLPAFVHTIAWAWKTSSALLSYAFPIIPAGDAPEPLAAFSLHRVPCGQWQIHPNLHPSVWPRAASVSTDGFLFSISLSSRSPSSHA